MASRRRVSNPLALAVLGQLLEKPMHPYEMSRTMRLRKKESSIKLNYGALYSVVEKLEKHGLIEAVETVREGRRPERTVYQLTSAGRAEYEDWMAELLGTPVKEYTQFEAALAMLAGLPPDDVVDLLEQRLFQLDVQLQSYEHAGELAEKQVPRLFYIEWDYVHAMTRAERDWVAKQVEDIRSGTFDGLDLWRRLHENKD